MTQYNDRVQKQRDLLKAEEWAKQVKSIHAHSISSMFYDTRPQDTEDGKSVMIFNITVDLLKEKHMTDIQFTLEKNSKVINC